MCALQLQAVLTPLLNTPEALRVKRSRLDSRAERARIKLKENAIGRSPKAGIARCKLTTAIATERSEVVVDGPSHR